MTHCSVPPFARTSPRFFPLLAAHPQRQTNAVHTSGSPLEQAGSNHGGGGAAAVDPTVIGDVGNPDDRTGASSAGCDGVMRQVVGCDDADSSLSGNSDDVADGSNGNSGAAGDVGNRKGAGIGADGDGADSSPAASADGEADSERTAGEGRRGCWECGGSEGVGPDATAGLEPPRSWLQTQLMTR